MSNPFLDLFERQAPSPVKARARASETRQSKRRDEEQQKQLSAYYKAQRRQELNDALAGEHGSKLQALIAQLDTLTHETIPQLAAFVRANGWHSAAATTLFMARLLASETIVRLREKNGLAPFDDPLPGEPATPEQGLRAAFADNPERDALDHEKAHGNGNLT